MTSARDEDPFSDDAHYRCPTDLAVSDLGLKRVLVVGSCMTQKWPQTIKAANPECACDFLLMNNVQRFPAMLPARHAEYDFQIVQVPLRILVLERAFMRLDYADMAGFKKMFETATQRLRAYLAEAMRLNQEFGLLTFVFTFLQPQQNPLGRLLPRYDLRNFVYFVEQLNEQLHRIVAEYRNAHIFDYNEVAATFGRKYLQDDSVYHLTHASVLTQMFDYRLDQDRLEPTQPMHRTYPIHPRFYALAGWSEILAMYRTVRQIGSVKLVIVDLDDTIWRGVAADAPTTSDPDLLTGWPLGFIEALILLKRRGTLLAVVSKNDEAVAVAFWNKVVGDRFHLGNFAMRRINWQPKADNIREILATMNLLAHNVVFIDDNPVEREFVRTALPGIRTFGPNPYLWRRLLLWSAETQVASVTTESANRTDMVQAQVRREDERTQMSREEFLETLDLRLTMKRLASVSDPSFPRAFELLNKTNQFNTTGERWRYEQCAEAFRNGFTFHVFEVTDRFTAYGLVGVLVTKNADIRQFVMSCRVAGLDVELAALGLLLRSFVAGGANRCARSRVVDTPLNLLCRDVFEQYGFRQNGDEWVIDLAGSLPIPAHVRVAGCDLEAIC